MNFEQLLKQVKNNFHRLKNLKKTKLLFQYYVNLLARKRKKLKLGKVGFFLKQKFYGGILIHEEWEMVYVRQDNTRYDELKLENRLKAIS
jgi:hypothetical protein